MLGLSEMADQTLLLKNADLLCTMAAHPEKGYRQPTPLDRLMIIAAMKSKMVAFLPEMA